MLREELVKTHRVVGSDWPRLRLTPKHAETKSKRGEAIYELLQPKRSPDRADALAYLWRAVRELVGGNRPSPWIDRPLICSHDGGVYEAYYEQAAAGERESGAASSKTPEDRLKELLEWMARR